MSELSRGEFPAAALALPPELQGPAPREVPAAAIDGPLAIARRRLAWGLFAAGAACLLLSFVPLTATLALYLLPLGYLHWIGLALCLASLATRFFGREYARAVRYVQQGEAGHARVTALALGPSRLVNGQPVSYAYQAELELPHPDTGQTTAVTVKSRDYSEPTKDRVAPRFRVGDDVAVAWLPGQFDKTVQAYDFLELTPAASLLRRDAPAASVWQTVVVAVLAPLLFFVLFWNLYAMGRYAPLDFDYVGQGGLPLLLGAAVAAAGCIWRWIVQRRKQVALRQRNAAAVDAGEPIEIPPSARPIVRYFGALAVALGAMLLCGITVLMLAFTVNAVGDRSPAERIPVAVTDAVQVTHNFIFREYKLTYRFPDRDDDYDLLTTPQHIDQFDLPIGTAVTRAGRLGWPWVETIEPLAPLAN